MQNELLIVEENMNKIIKKPLFWGLVSLAIVLLTTGTIIVYSIMNTTINGFITTLPSSSMENTIMTNDKIAGIKNAYKNNNPKRGDIIAFRFPDNENDVFVKRIIGLPGEIVHIKKGKIYINYSEESLKEDYLKEEWIECNNYDEPFIVPKDSYFCLGDNRNVSNDSRFWNNKYVNRNQIIAKIEEVISPKSHAKELKTPQY